MYDHDLNYYFNSDNIKNQDLVFEIFDYFDTGDGRKYFPPLDFFNILLWNVDFLEKEIDKPFDILRHLQKLEVPDIERHLIYAFILKWFGGYPVNNFNPKYATVLRLIQKQYTSYHIEQSLLFEEKLNSIKEEYILKGKVIADATLRQKIDDGSVLFLRKLDLIVKAENNQGKKKSTSKILDQSMDTIRVTDTHKKDLRIFISHSSKDKVIVGEFIDKILKLCLKIETDQIFFTSFKENTIHSGDDFRNTIKENLIRSSLVLLIITDNYKKSEVCLNEMGAAWVLNAAVTPFILSPINYDSVGFIHNPNQLLKLNDKGDIIQFIDEQKGEDNKIKHGEIDRHVTDFLKILHSVSDITIEIKNDVDSSSKDQLSDGDIVAIENRDSLYLFQNHRLVHIADDSEFSLFVYGFNYKNAKVFKYQDIESLIDDEQSIPVLHSCKIIIDTTTEKKWLVVNEERRSLPNSVYAILVKKTPQPRVVSLSHQEVMRLREGDKLTDVGTRFH